MAVSARIRHAAAVLLLAASGGLAACTSNPTPAPLPSLSPSQSGGPSATDPTPPVLPAAAHGTGPKAAKAFARYYFRVINYAALSGDTSDLKRLSSRHCKSCAAITTNIEKIYGHGGRITHEIWSLRTVTILMSRREHTALSLGAYLGKEVIVHANRKRDVRPAGKQPMNMRLQRQGPSFVVTSLDLVS